MSEKEAFGQGATELTGRVANVPTNIRCEIHCEIRRKVLSETLSLLKD